MELGSRESPEDKRGSIVHISSCIEEAIGLYWNDNPVLVQPMADAVQRNNLGRPRCPRDMWGDEWGFWHSNDKKFLVIIIKLGKEDLGVYIKPDHRAECEPEQRAARGLSGTRARGGR